MGVLGGGGEGTIKTNTKRKMMSYRYVVWGVLFLEGSLWEARVRRRRPPSEVRDA